MFGPIVGGLTNKFGLRKICISGSIIATIGLLLSTLSPNVSILMITLGAIGGLGAGAINLPANIAVGYYFETKRALATGISQCGSGVGQFVFAPLATLVLTSSFQKMDNEIEEELVKNITTPLITTITNDTNKNISEQCVPGNDIDAIPGWKVHIYIIAGLIFLCSFFGALLLDLKEEEFVDEDGKKTTKTSTTNLLPSICLNESKSQKKEVKIVKPFSRNDIYYNKDVNKLVAEEHTTETWDEFRHLLLTPIRYDLFFDCSETFYLYNIQLYISKSA